MLKEMFQQQARNERYNTHKALVKCKMSLGSSVSAHVIKMKDYNLERLDAKVSHEMSTDMILEVLPPSFEQFIMNYNMHDMNRSITQFHGMIMAVKEGNKSIVDKNVLINRKANFMKMKLNRQGKGQWE